MGKCTSVCSIVPHHSHRAKMSTPASVLPAHALPTSSRPTRPSRCRFRTAHKRAISPLWNGSSARPGPRWPPCDPSPTFAPHAPISAYAPWSFSRARCARSEKIHCMALHPSTEESALPSPTTLDLQRVSISSFQRPPRMACPWSSSGQNAARAATVRAHCWPGPFAETRRLPLTAAMMHHGPVATVCSQWTGRSAGSRWTSSWSPLLQSRTCSTFALCASHHGSRHGARAPKLVNPSHPTHLLRAPAQGKGALRQHRLRHQRLRLGLGQHLAQSGQLAANVHERSINSSKRSSSSMRSKGGGRSRSRSRSRKKDVELATQMRWRSCVDGRHWNGRNAPAPTSPGRWMMTQWKAM
mmetsp:Transcript_23204/g.74678  ORF Transcript_23204/g.74678 Transcript_23204/m.74678 type:complete len:355 (+) Transcript_23204:2138-3202(+)